MNIAYKLTPIIYMPTDFDQQSYSYRKPIDLSRWLLLWLKVLL